MTHPAVTQAPISWHTLSPAETISRLDTHSEQGLTSEQIRSRQEQYGANEIIATGGRSNWQVLLDQFTNIMLLMLFGVALVSAYLDITDGEFPKDAVAILAIVTLNGILGYLQETRAEQALAALKQLSSPIVKVRRNGVLQEVSAKELVPGDWVLLESGVQIPADGRLWDAANLQVREAALTGEAIPISKESHQNLAEDTALGDRTNMVFQGTEVMQGRGTMIVTHTGMQTELGKVATLLKSVESEPTPLQQRMDQLGHVLVYGSLALVAVVVLGGVAYAGWDAFRELLIISLSMAVAVVPEGLPAVITVTLAIGTQRMVRRQALIRRLPAVETLGSVTAICSDKTGTLTENKMVVTAIETVTGHYSVTGTGYVPEGDFYCQGSLIQPLQTQDLAMVLLAGVVCNDATLNQSAVDHRGTLSSEGKASEDKVWAILGDPTEGALLSLAGKANLFKETLGSDLPRVGEIAFTSERKRMSVLVSLTHLASDHSVRPLLDSIHLTEKPYALFGKGSPEMLLERCQWILVEGEMIPITSTHHNQIRTANEALASQGLRVLGTAMVSLTALPETSDLEPLETNLVWLGLVGMRDAPRREAFEAVAKCRQAGIRPMMITGDHQLTAIAIAKDLGIAQEQEQAIEGKALARMSAAELDQTVRSVSVYARVAPEHKLWIVRALQKQTQFVAMTGDGVNDAPALKQANIGIAMGITGTDVSKEASDMILLNDNFATIVDAIEEGRIVYSNIRRFIKYILGSNIGEVLTILASGVPVIGEVPLSPLQILWMNLVTDGLPALALALEPAEEGAMKRPPIDPQESIFARGLGAYMIRVGIIFALTTIAMMLIIKPYFLTWKTMVFTTLCVSQMGHALAVRSSSKFVFQMNPTTNPYLYWAVGLTVALQLALIYIPFLRAFFDTEALSSTELLICFGFSALVLVWVELEKLIIMLVGQKVPSWRGNP